ncbi:ComEA family DNA-binding protein [Nakamurella silvestris]|nr:ComEA family DNA-binding protein [Nakamurella silvestris]
MSATEPDDEHRPQILLDAFEDEPGHEPVRSPPRGLGRFTLHRNRIAERWVPEPLRGARVDPGRRGALTLGVVAALAACAAAVGVWINRPQVVPTPPAFAATAATGPVEGPTTASDPSGRPLTAAAPTTAAPVPESSSVLAPTVIVVSVTGLVHRQGVVTLPQGARVADAIAAAGGVRSKADLAGVNLAQRLADGDSVVIGPAGTSTTRQSAPGQGTSDAPGTGSSAGDVAGPPQLVDLNTATESELEQLPGVGPVMAGNIIAWRESHGTFTSIDQLEEVGGIGEVRLARLAPLVTL